MTQQSKQLIVGVDVIRFVAATMVMCMHLCTSSWWAPYSSTYLITGGRARFPELFAITWFGWVGVQIFFVISGLVIAYSAENANAWSFARHRFLRLYPGAWTCATITAITLVAIGGDARHQIMFRWIGAMTLFPFPPWLDPAYWTMGIEIAFYGLVFLLLSFQAFHLFEYVVLALGTTSSAYWILGAAFAPSFLSQHFESRRLELSLIAHGYCFAIGALAYVTARKGVSAMRMFAMALFIVAAMIEIGYTSAALNPLQSAMPPQGAFLVAIALIFISTRYPSGKQNRTGRLVRIIGLATYPLYLLHQIVGAAIMKWMLDLGGSRYAALGAALTLCILASFLIAHAIEPALRSTIRKIFAKIGKLPRHRLVTGA